MSCNEKKTLYLDALEKKFGFKLFKTIKRCTIYFCITLLKLKRYTIFSSIVV